MRLNIYHHQVRCESANSSKQKRRKKSVDLVTGRNLNPFINNGAYQEPTLRLPKQVIVMAMGTVTTASSSSIQFQFFLPLDARLTTLNIASLPRRYKSPILTRLGS